MREGEEKDWILKTQNTLYRSQNETVYVNK